MGHYSHGRNIKMQLSDVIGLALMFRIVSDVPDR
jgi:hypothetical protein